MYQVIKKFGWTIEQYENTDIQKLNTLITIMDFESKKEQMELDSNKNNR